MGKTAAWIGLVGLAVAFLASAVTHESSKGPSAAWRQTNPTLYALVDRRVNRQFGLFPTHNDCMMVGSLQLGSISDSWTQTLDNDLNWKCQPITAPPPPKLDARLAGTADAEKSVWALTMDGKVDGVAGFKLNECVELLRSWQDADHYAGRTVKRTCEKVVSN